MMMVMMITKLGCSFDRSLLNISLIFCKSKCFESLVHNGNRDDDDNNNNNNDDDDNNDDHDIHLLIIKKKKAAAMMIIMTMTICTYLFEC